MPAKYSKEEFISKANIKHKGYYDYSKVDYINALTKVEIICPKHGIFEQQPNNHLHGQGCIKCMGDRVRKSRISNTEEFIKKSQKIHKDLYDYSKVEYIKGRDKVIIICPYHGEFKQTPFAHSSPSMSQGCPLCKVSKGERLIESYLKNKNIEYIREHRFTDCINPKTNKTLPFDFYLPFYNMVIEYHGEQHYKKMGTYFESKAGGLKNRKYRDKLKKDFCLSKTISFIEIPYTQYNNINTILNQIL
jgi:hypothetical protein